MATADPHGDPMGAEPDGRPTLTRSVSPRGDPLARDDPSTPGPGGRISARHPNQDLLEEAANRSEEGRRRRSYTTN